MSIVFSRHAGESIVIGDEIMVTVVDIRGKKLRLEFHAPISVPIYRSEVFMAIAREDARAEGRDPDESDMSGILGVLQRREKKR